jgi:hypothetical protein
MTSQGRRIVDKLQRSKSKFQSSSKIQYSNSNKTALIKMAGRVVVIDFRRQYSFEFRAVSALIGACLEFGAWHLELTHQNPSY